MYLSELKFYNHVSVEIKILTLIDEFVILVYPGRSNSRVSWTSSFRAHDVGAVDRTSGKAHAGHGEGVFPQGRDHLVAFSQLQLKLLDHLLQVLLFTEVFVLLKSEN